MAANNDYTYLNGSAIFLSSSRDLKIFNENFEFIRQTFGSFKVSSENNETIEIALQRLKNFSEIALKQTDPSLSEKNFIAMSEEVITISKAINSFLDDKIDLFTQGKMGYLAFLVAVVGSNVLAGEEFSKIQTEAQISALKIIWNKYTGAYHFSDKYYAEGIEKDKYLRSLRSRIFNNMSYHIKRYTAIALSAEEIEYHLDRKNEKSKLFGGFFYGKFIDNKESEHTVIIDQECVNKLYEEILKIKSKSGIRTQFIVRPFGNYAHVFAFDICYNKNDNVIEIISLESAYSKSQWDFLKSLTELLTKHSEKYAIIAIQTRLQKNTNGCPVFTISLASVSCKLTFSALKNCDPEIQSAEFNKVSFKDPFGNTLLLPELPPLENVTWLPVSVLGHKAVLMGQSVTEMRENLTQIDPLNIKRIMSEWSRFYNCDRKTRKTYYDYRLYSLRSKFNGGPFRGLTVQGVCEKLKTAPDEVMTESLAFCRQAAGWGPLREMEFFIAILERQKRLQTLDIKGKDGRTPLHWALAAGKINRACLLLSKGVKTDIPDGSGKTARDYFADAPEQVKSNAYLQRFLD